MVIRIRMAMTTMRGANNTKPKAETTTSKIRFWIIFLVGCLLLAVGGRGRLRAGDLGLRT